MRGYIDYVKIFRNKTSDEIVNKLKSYYKEAEQSQIDSWYELIRVLKSTNSLKDLPEDLIIAIEYSLPTDGMALDLMFIGSIGWKEYAFILESKQWGDDYITGSKFSEFRGDDVLLYPQVQVHHHEISFRNYLNIGTRIAKVYPYVYLENATQIGVDKALQNPDPNSKAIPVITDMNVFINKIIHLYIVLISFYFFK